MAHVRYHMLRYHPRKGAKTIYLSVFCVLALYHPRKGAKTEEIEIHVTVIQYLSLIHI